MADTAYIKLNIRKIAVLFINAPYGQGITKVFTEKFESLGGNISITESYTQGATDYRTQLTKIKDTGVKWVFVPGYVKEIVNILKQAQELALDVRFLGVNSMYDPKLLEIAGETAEGSVFSIPTYDPNSEEPIIRKFVASYKAAYDSEPDAFAATGYDAMRVMLEAIKLGGGTTGLGIQKGMMLIKDFTGPSGVVTFDKNGDVNKPLRLMTVRNGRFVSLGGEL
jgi:branched-chain amino acid transport system substrate-binding protein